MIKVLVLSAVIAVPGIAHCSGLNVNRVLCRDYKAGAPTVTENVFIFDSTFKPNSPFFAFNFINEVIGHNDVSEHKKCVFPLCPHGESAFFLNGQRVEGYRWADRPNYFLKGPANIAGGSLASVFNYDFDLQGFFITPMQICGLKVNIRPHLLLPDFTSDSHRIVSRSHGFSGGVQGSIDEPNRPRANTQSQYASRDHCPLCPAIPKNDVWVLLRIFITVFGATSIMFGAGFVSWEGDRWLNWRWLYGGLFGGLLVSGLWLYFWLGFIFLSL